MELPKNKVIEVKLDEDARRIARPSEYGAAIDDWIQYLVSLESAGYLSFGISYEHGYYDSVDIVLKSKRRETDEEVAAREAEAKEDERQQAEHEQREYERLKKKFDNGETK